MSNISKKLTFYLFAEPSFTEGISRVLDLGRTMQIYNESETEEKADAEALKKDWRIVGEDIRKAIYKYGRNSK